MRLIQSFLIAFSTYSRIPMPKADWTDENRKYSMCFFPLIGLVIGVLMGFWLWLCAKLDFGLLIKGAVSALIPLLVTGGIHMDGFLDTTDALSSWQSKEKRLEILKDTHVGAFAVIYGCAYLLLFAGVFSEAAREDHLPLALGFVLSRALSALALTNLKSARENGMLHSFAKTADQKRVNACMAAYIIVCELALFLLDWRRALAGLAACAISFSLYKRRAYKCFGGVTGDLAGHFLQRCELLFAIAVIFIGRII